MPGPAFLHGDDVTLNTVEEADIDFLNDHINDAAVRIGLGSADPKNSSQTQEFFEESVSSDESVNLLVCVDDEPVGQVSAHRMDEKNGTTEVGCWLAPEFHGEGYAADATRRLLRYLFEERRIQTVTAHVFAFNEPSYRLLESVGFERVGEVPNQLFVDGEHHDDFVYAMTVDDWRAGD
ncbi:GNAT family N-acetyltransferase [Haloarchaeobius sp. DFWS5]|uniref:GNAT family N-acetyltransferase n=1 Tax=Haloarchaeobius sp. DFWS5 TaxID=3446114 RepID=UPI003EC1260E